MSAPTTTPTRGTGYHADERLVVHAAIAMASVLREGHPRTAAELAKKLDRWADESAMGEMLAEGWRVAAEMLRGENLTAGGVEL